MNTPQCVAVEDLKSYIMDHTTQKKNPNKGKDEVIVPNVGTLMLNNCSSPGGTACPFLLVFG